jgi:hypothetical protein
VCLCPKVQRKLNREIEDIDTLATALAEASARPVHVYWGNESLADTVALFANAVAVVGVHGIAAIRRA